MLSYLVQRDPATIFALGVTPDFIKQELARSQAAAKWRATTQQQKAEKDAAAWRSWLTRYGARLEREAAKGGSVSERVRAMNAANPRVVLRNWVAQEAIQVAEAGDYEAVRKLLAVMAQPYKEVHEAALGAGGQGAAAAGAVGAGAAPNGEGPGGAAGPPERAAGICPFRVGGKPPAWAGELCVTCSS